MPTQNSAGKAVGRRELAQQIASRSTGITEDQVYEVLTAFTETVTENLASGRPVTLTGFGTWSPTTRAARTGTNIRTRERIKIPERKSANFSLGAHLKGALSGT